MNILSIHGKNMPMPRRKLDALAARGVSVIEYSPTLFSAFAAMRISSIIDKENISVIEVSTVKDAMAATSARDLARKKNVKVVMNIPPNTRPPKGVAGDIRRKVDTWIFPTTRLMEIFPAGLNNTVVIPSTSFAGPADPPSSDHDIPVVSWIGDINRPDRLKAFLEEAEDTQGQFSIRVSGAGDAAKVMPVVRLSRYLSRNKDLTWLGEEYDPMAEIAACDAVFASDDDITEIEATAVLSGRPLLQPGDLAAFLSGSSPAPPTLLSPEEYISRYIDTLQA